MIRRPPSAIADASSPSKNISTYWAWGRSHPPASWPCFLSEHVSVATYVLVLLAFSAAIVTLLIASDIRNTTHSVFPTPKGLPR